MEKTGLGIDVGYTSVCVYGMQNGQPVNIRGNPNDNNSAKIPAIVSYSYQGERFANLFGHEAVQAIAGGKPVLHSMKRLLGRSYTDPEVQKQIQDLPFEICKDSHNKPRMRIHYSYWKKETKKFYPEEVLAKILKHMKDVAAIQFSVPSINKAVLTIPSHFNWFQRLAMKDAALLAGFKSVEIITEATAAIVAHFHNFPNVTETVLVFHLGRCSFDLTLVKVVRRNIYMKTLGDDAYLGGEDFTGNLVEYCTSEFKKQRGYDYNTKYLDALAAECVKKKEELFSQSATSQKIKLPGYYTSSVTITRDHFEKINQSLLEKIFQLTDQVVARAELRNGDIDTIIMAGGATRIPAILNKLKTDFPKSTIKTGNEDKIFAMGAAIQANTSNGFVEHLGLPSEEQILERIRSLPVFGICTTEAIGVWLNYDYQIKQNHNSDFAVVIPQGVQVPCSYSTKLWFMADEFGWSSLKVYEGNNSKAIKNRFVDSVLITDLEPKAYFKLELKFHLEASGKLEIKPVIINWLKDEGKEKFVTNVFKNRTKHLKVHRLGDGAQSTLINTFPSVQLPDGGGNRIQATQIEMAKVLYAEKMYPLISSIHHVPEEILQQAQDDAVQAALEFMCMVHPLTPDVILQTKRPLESLFQKYERMNELKREAKGSKSIIGIDLGTTHCCLAYIDTCGKMNIIPNVVGQIVTPSYVAFNDDEVVVGNSAKDNPFQNPANSIFDMKRMIGRHFRNPEIQTFKKYWPFKLKNDNGNILVHAGEKDYRPEEIVTFLVKHLAEMAADFLSEPIVNVVVAIPAYFSPRQRYLTIEAFHDANLNVIDLVNEPTAAALAYHDMIRTEQNHGLRHCLVFDLGGGTFDVAILEQTDNEIKVLATDCDPNVGGEDFDNALMEYCLKEFCGQNDVELLSEENSNYARQIRRLRLVCEREKKHLSAIQGTTVSCDAFYNQKDLIVQVTRDIFNSLIKKYLLTCMSIVDRVLDEVKSPVIAEIVLVGGSSKIPLVQNMLKDKFPNATISKKLNPDEAVARGAAITAIKKQKSQQRDIPDYKSNNFEATQIDLAKVLYGEKMQPIIASIHPVPEDVLQEAHEDAVQAALELMSKIHPLTTDVVEDTKHPLEIFFRKYKKMNTLKQEAEGSKSIIGIDLGTTTCCLAYADSSGKIKIIPNVVGKDVTPSYVAFDKKEVKLGNAAKNDAYLNPANTIFDMKRIIGRHFKNPEIQVFKKYWPFKIQEDQGNILVHAAGTDYRPEEIVTFLVKHLAETAADFLNEPVVNVVVAIPAYFSPRQRYLTIEAFHDANLNVVCLISEPTAAALAYHDKIKEQNDGSRHCLVFDLGGGTFDVAVLEEAEKEIKILAIDGDPNLGGEDFDNALMEYCLKEFCGEHKMELLSEENSNYARQIRRLKLVCEDAKERLTSSRATTVSCDAFYNQKDLVVQLTREIFNSLIGDYLLTCMSIVDRVLDEARVPEIGEIVLVGGSSRIPLVQSMLKEKFPGVVISKKLNPDKAVARGAAILASFIQQDKSTHVSIKEMDKTVLF